MGFHVCHPVTLKSSVPETPFPTSQATIPSVSELISGAHLTNISFPLQLLQMKNYSDKTLCHLEMSLAGMALTALYSSESSSPVPSAEQTERLDTSSTLSFPAPAVSFAVESSAANDAPVTAIHHLKSHLFGCLASPLQVISPLYTRIAPQSSTIMVQQLPRHDVQRALLRTPKSFSVPVKGPEKFIWFGNMAPQPNYTSYRHIRAASSASIPCVLLLAINYNYNVLNLHSHVSSIPDMLLYMVLQRSLVSLVSVHPLHHKYAAESMLYILPYERSFLYVPCACVSYSLQPLEQGMVPPHRIQMHDLDNVSINQALVIETDFSEQNYASINKQRRVKRLRSRSGCLTCRKRRIKCDEHKPRCSNCEHLKRLCMGYEVITGNCKSRGLKTPSLQGTIRPCKFYSESPLSIGSTDASVSGDIMKPL